MYILSLINLVFSFVCKLVELFAFELFAFAFCLSPLYLSLLVSNVFIFEVISFGPYPLYSTRTHSVYSKQSRKFELTRIVFRMSLSSETYAVNFCQSFRSRSESFVSRIFFVSEKPDFTGLPVPTFSRQRLRNLSHRIRSGS